MGRRSPPKRASSRCRRGLTLLELVVSTVATAVLLSGIASAILLASRAVPDRGDALDAIPTAGDTLELLAGELAEALSVTEMTATSIEFTVSDRTGDGQPETIRYAWSGTPGTSLTRQQSSSAGGGPAEDGPTVPILSDVAAFELSYQTVTVTAEGDPTETVSDETLLAAYTSSTNLADGKVKSDLWQGQYFRPALPRDTIRWKATRVRLYAASEGAAKGVALVQLRRAGADSRPTADVLAQHTLSEDTLSSSYQWRDFNWPSAPDLLPSDEVCLVLEHVTDADACKVRYQTQGVVAPSLARVQSTNKGSSWSVFNDQSLLFYVYGVITRPGPGEPQSTQRLQAVRIRLQAGEDQAAEIETSVYLLNAPEVSE